MGRPKREMKKIHSRKLKKAREKIKKLGDNTNAIQKLPKLSRRILQKRYKHQQMKKP